MDACFSSVGRSFCKKNSVTVEHHYRVDIFIVTIDQQLLVEDIYLHVDKFYPKEFFDQEIIHLRFQLQYYELDVPNHPKLKNMSSLADLCQRLVETEKSIVYSLIDRLIQLILILYISTLTTERVFSTMKIVKIRLRNQMNDDFLVNYLIVYIEK